MTNNSAAPPDQTPYLLYLDDDEDDRLIFEEAAALQGVFVRSFSRYEDLLNCLCLMAHSQKPCLIVIDYNMPQRKGDAVLRELAALSEADGVPAVILTTTILPDQHIYLLNLGAKACYSKPVDYWGMQNTIISLKQWCRKDVA